MFLNAAASNPPAFLYTGSDFFALYALVPEHTRRAGPSPEGPHLDGIVAAAGSQASVRLGGAFGREEGTRGRGWRP